MTIPYTAPEFEKSSFNCPHCQAFSSHQWYQSEYSQFRTDINGLKISICNHCKRYSVWLFNKLVFPDYSGIENPNADLTEEIKQDYIEAASIVQKSPRGAAALLRLSVQKLCKQLGEKGNDINNDIASLVKKGLPDKIQKALDTVRVTGNEAVHPGELDLKDSQEVANKLFKLVNFIAEKMISEPKEVDNMFDGLPEKKKEAIKERDKK